MSDKAQQFDRAMVAIYEEAARKYNYRATYFLNMVTEYGGVEAAKRLLQKEGFSDGFTTLWELGRLDLSVEAHVIKPEYSDLFTPEEIAVAEQRLRALNYTFDT